MATSSATQEEIDVMFDANVAPIKSAFDYIQKEVANLRSAVTDIGKLSTMGVREAGAQISKDTRALSNALKQMKTLTGPGSFASDFEAVLKQQTAQSKAFFRQQESDRKESISKQNKAEIEGAKLVAAENSRIVAKEIESAKLLRAAKLEAAKAGVVDSSREIRDLDMLNAARNKSADTLRKYRAAARGETDPEQQRALSTLIELEKLRARTLETVNRELLRGQASENRAAATQARQEQLAETRALAQAERERAAAARVAAQEQAKADQARMASLRELAKANLESGKANAVNQAKSLVNNPQGLAEARAANIAELQRLRALRNVETDPVKNRELAALVEIEKARAVALANTTRELEKQQRAAAGKLAGDSTGKVTKALIPGDVRDMANALGPKQAQLGLLFEQEMARKKLLAATTEQERVVALGNLDIATRRVDAVNRLVREEENVLRVERQIAEANMAGNSAVGKATAPSFASRSVSEQGIDTARAEAKQRVAMAETRVAVATNETRKAALAELEVEKARQREIEKIGLAQAAEGRGSIMGRASTAIKNTALYGLVAGLGYGAFNAFQQTLSSVIEIEDEFVKLQAISDSTDGQMTRLKATIYGIGEGSRFAVNDLVKVAQTLAQAGVAADQMGKVLTSVTTLATASGSTPDEAVNLVTAALGSFQLQASESARIADLMTSALNRTKLTVGQVGQAIQYVGATAYEQNITLENLLATVGAVAQGGVRSGSTIGTGFRQFLVDLQTPSEKLKFQLDRLGITQDQVNVKTQGLASVLETLKTKGFGATQAYDGLETRAAAFYLVAKNNVDVMKDLQLSFAEQGAAAIANERAMNSVTAQWTRFKNILQEGFGDAMQEPITILKNLLMGLSDRLVEIRRAALEIKNKNADGTAGFMDKDLTPYLKPLVEGGLNLLSTGRQEAGIGSWIARLSEDSATAADKANLFATAIKDSTQKVQEHNDTITELDKEMSRLQAQQGTLIKDTKMSQVETVSLTAKFGGLVNYLGTTKNAYLDLIGAMGAYRGEQERILSASLNSQVAFQQKQNNLDSASLQGTVKTIKNNPELMRLLSPGQQKILDNPSDLRFPQMMREAAEKVAKSNSDLANVLNDAALYSGRLTGGLQMAKVGAQQAQAAAASGTSLGQQVNKVVGVNQRDLDALSTQDGGERAKNGARISSNIRTYIGTLEKKLTTVKEEGNRTFIQDSIATLRNMLDQVAAAIKPSAEEIKDAKKAKREADIADREASKKPKVTQADLDGILKGLGLPTNGSGTRTPAEQEALHASGATRARGFGPHQSDHVGNVARDVSTRGMSAAQVKEKAALIRAQLKAAGLNDDDFQVIIETGKGKNQGTGPHIHTGIRRGARKGTGGRGDAAADQYDAQLDQDQISLAEGDLKLKMKDIAKASSTESLAVASDAAEKALEKLNGAVMTAARSELISKGIDPDGASPAAKVKMAQVAETIANNFKDFDQQISDRVLKSIKVQLKAAQTAFDKAIEPSLTAQKIAEARVSGLGYASNENKVPDFYKSAMERQARMAAENTDRSRLAALPAQIGVQESKLADVQNSFQLSPEDRKAQIEELTGSIKELKAARDSLDVALNAGQYVPTTIADAATMAIEEYRKANDLTKSFKDTVIQNVSGGISELHNGLTTMFSDIFTGSQTALQAFGNFAKGVGKYIAELAAKFVASQLINMLLSIGMSAFGGKIGGAGTASTGAKVDFINSNSAAGILTTFNGGKVAPEGSPFAGAYKHYMSGGRVANGSDQSDSVHSKLAKGEWVVQKSAVDSVGDQFMANLNNHGAKAVASTNAMPKINMVPKQEMGVYIVAPEQKPSLTKKDVLVSFAEDILAGGETKKLIKYVSQGG